MLIYIVAYGASKRTLRGKVLKLIINLHILLHIQEEIDMAWHENHFFVPSYSYEISDEFVVTE